MKLPELDELYRRYRMDLYRYLCFLTHDPVQAAPVRQPGRFDGTLHN